MVPTLLIPQTSNTTKGGQSNEAYPESGGSALAVALWSPAPRWRHVEGYLPEDPRRARVRQDAGPGGKIEGVEVDDGPLQRQGCVGEEAPSRSARRRPRSRPTRAVRADTLNAGSGGSFHEHPKSARSVANGSNQPSTRTGAGSAVRSPRVKPGAPPLRSARPPIRARQLPSAGGTAPMSVLRAATSAAMDALRAR